MFLEAFLEARQLLTDKLEGLAGRGSPDPLAVINTSYHFFRVEEYAHAIGICRSVHGL